MQRLYGSATPVFRKYDSWGIGKSSLAFASRESHSSVWEMMLPDWCDCTLSPNYAAPFYRRSMKKITSLAVIIALGILSRIVHTGWIAFDKYLGDGLYAAMGYTLISLFSRDRTALWRAVVAMLVMTGIELFQLTLIPAQMVMSGDPLVRIAARLLGTQFSFLDLLAYGVGIIGVLLLDAKTGTA